MPDTKDMNNSDNYTEILIDLSDCRVKITIAYVMKSHLPIFAVQITVSRINFWF